MQVLISSARPDADLAQIGSARKGRAIDTRSQSPRSRMALASCGMLMRFDATTGIVTSRRNRPATEANAARGTEVTMVGTLASCQPKPVFKIVTPACSSALATATTSSQVLPPSTRSSSEWRYMMMKLGPTAAGCGERSTEEHAVSMFAAQRYGQIRARYRNGSINSSCPSRCRLSPLRRRAQRNSRRWCARCTLARGRGEWRDRRFFCRRETTTADSITPACRDLMTILTPLGRSGHLGGWARRRGNSGAAKRRASPDGSANAPVRQPHAALARSGKGGQLAIMIKRSSRPCAWNP